jgi:hypothetical protein
MAQSTPVHWEGIAQVAGRILLAWRSGENSHLRRELDHARRLASEPRQSSTLEMERMEVLSGAVESLGHGHREQAGAVRLLEHLATMGSAPHYSPSHKP